MVKKDPYKHESKYKGWQAKGMPIKGLGEPLAARIRVFLNDMEVGANVSPGSKRGPRSYCRLNNLRSRMQTWGFYVQEELDISTWEELEHKERELLLLIKKLRDGVIGSRWVYGGKITAVGTYVKILKSFWHWHQRVERKQGREVGDITVDLDARDAKPKFNYFTVEDLKKLCDNAKKDYKVMMMFLFDTGIRAPTELMNVRVDDLEWESKTGIYTLNIREETSKTFGRRIKLMLCSDTLKEHLQLKNLKPDEYIFTGAPQRMNQYLRMLGYRILGIGKKVGEGEYSVKNGITLYDFRHAAACYWLPRYKSESALKYRFGWKKSDMIHYYTELLGMKDTIQEEDLYVDISKTELERDINEKGKEIELLKEQLLGQDQKMTRMMKVLEALQMEKVIETS